VELTVQRALHTVKANAEFHRVDVSISCKGRCETWFDEKKLERALVNVLLNACQVVPAYDGRVEVDLREEKKRVEIRIVDNGPGIPEPIREKLFQPFVSYGKQNGIGLGLAIGHKIFQDHGGDACLESSEPGRTVFKFTLPVVLPDEPTLSN
jgi:signal transduction histidine kinase